jgi:ABC-type transport system involved in multi-copper enzyme maturation permease subunit
MNNSTTAKIGAIFSNELRNRWKGVMIWVISWAAMSAMLMLFFDTLAASKDQLEAVFSTLPPELFSAFATDLKTLGTIEGYINSQLLSLLMIAGPIWSAWFGSQLIAGEHSNGSISWLLVQPVSRFASYTAKASAGIFWMFLANGLIMAATVIFTLLFTQVNDIPWNYFASVAIGLSLYSTVFLLVGNLVGILHKQSSGILVGAGLMAFSFTANLISAIENTPEFFKYLSLYYYFNVEKLSNGQALGSEILLLPAICLVLIVLGFQIFRSKDFS